MTITYDFMNIEMGITVEQDLLDYQLRADIKCHLADGQEISFVHVSEFLNRVDHPDIEKQIGRQLYDMLSSAAHRLTYKLSELGSSLPIEREK